MKLPASISSLLARRAIREGGAVLFDHGLLSIAMFITGLLLARSVGKDDYGTYVLIISLIVNIQSMQKSLFSVPFTIKSPHSLTEKRKQLLGSTVILTLLYLVILAFLAAATFATRLADWLTDISPAYLLCALLALVPYTLREHIRGSMLALLKVWSALVPNILAAITQIALVLWLYTKSELDSLSALLALAATSLISVILMYPRFSENITFSLHRVKADFLSFMETGKWNALNIVLHFMASQAYPWIIAAMAGLEDVGIYGACFAVASLLTPLLRGANSYILPRMTHGNANGGCTSLKNIAGKSAFMLSIPFGVWAVIGILAGNEIMHYLYKGIYDGHYLLLLMLISRIFIEALSTPATSALQTLGESRIISASLVGGALITIGPGLLLISYYGLYGAGIATVLSSIATGAIKWIKLRKLLRMDSKLKLP